MIPRPRPATCWELCDGSHLDLDPGSACSSAEEEVGEVTLSSRRPQGQEAVQLVILPPSGAMELDEPEGVDLITRLVLRAQAAGWSLAPVFAALGPHLRH